jgi:hypothetical protein
MLFLERPITADHLRNFCDQFNEGLRIEYKSALSATVRDAIPKIISSFANSNGGVLIVGINALNGVPQPPFEGFPPSAREELPLTIENICLQNIYPPLFPRSTAVASGIGDQVFIIVEIEESGEAPHAIENSKRVYVRTGNAANPYDLAEVDLIIDLVKRRKGTLELKERLFDTALERASQLVEDQGAHVQVSICPTFPRLPLCSSSEVYAFAQNTLYHGASFFRLNSMKRVPDGAASLAQPRNPAMDTEYLELNKFGLLFSKTAFRMVPWGREPESPMSLSFGNVFHSLLKVIVGAKRFYLGTGYHGDASIRCSLHNVRGHAMRFIPGNFVWGDNIDKFRSYTNVVLSDLLVAVMQMEAQRIDTLTKIVSDLTWSFWQSPEEYPVNNVRAYLEQTVRGMGRL